MASLRKFEIINELKNQYGISISSVQKLNKILEAMGMHRRFGNGWGTTQKGMTYSIYRSPGFNQDLWRETIVPAIAQHIRSK